MTIDELQWFVVLAETEHMTEAATRLKVTQPTLSRALARLEHRLGTPLFDRANRRLRLNQYGVVFLEHARRCLLEMDTASDRIAGMIDPDRGVVRLAFLHSVATWLVPELLRQYRDEVPAVRFELLQAGGHELLENLRAGHVDLAVASPDPGDPGITGIGWHPMHREQLCLAVPVQHRLAGHSKCQLAEAEAEPFIALRPEFGLRELSDELCAQAKLRPDIAFESAEIASMEGLVAAGLGVAIVPAPRAGRATPGVAYLPLTDSGAHRVIGLIWLRNRPLPPVAARFAEFVRRRAPG